MKTLINSIFRSTEGEGRRLGTAQIFIRFQGCNIGCVNCDTMESWDFDPKYEMHLDDVFDQVMKISRDSGNLKNASLTGGDPTHPKIVPAVLELAKKLKNEGFTLSLEASGTRVIPELFEVIDFISFDFKTPSTGVRTRLELVEELYEKYPNKFQVKSVIQDDKDFFYTYEAYQSLSRKRAEKLDDWCLTPSYQPQEEFPLKRFLRTVELNEEHGGPFLVVGQQHKWLHGPDEQKV